MVGFNLLIVNKPSYLLEIELHVNSINPSGFGWDRTFSIPRGGHLISPTYLRVTLPPIEPIETVTNNFAWTRNIGRSLIDSVEISVGGTVIDRQYGEFLDIWQQLSEH